jgi:phage/plasmid primase-like uncharacterized protein
MAEIIPFFDLNGALTGADMPAPPSAADAADRFYKQAAEIGLDTRSIEFGVTSDIVRVPTTDDKPGQRSGWYVLHEEQGLFFGAMGNWRQGYEYVKFTGRDAAMVDAELMRRVHEKQEARKREAEEYRRRSAAAAAAMVPGLAPAPSDHPYLMRKQIGPNGALLLGNDLLLPIVDLAGNIVSTQTIGPEGDKSFRAGCTSKGMFVIGAPTANVVLCEGFATGASIHEATGLRVYVCFNAGNLRSLAVEIAEREARNGGARIVFAADNDLPNAASPNVGLTFATQAAEAIGGAEVLLPPVPGTDWNDVAIHDPATLRKAFATIRPLFQSWQVIDFALLPPRRWLYGTHYIRKFCSLTVAPGGLGKSTLALIEAIAMATGRNLLGINPVQRLKWVYFNAEDPLDEIMARVGAVLQHFNIPQEELVGHLFIASGREQEILLATGEQGDLIEVAFQMIAGFARYHGVDGITLDPLANMHDAPESNELMRKLGKRLSRLADELGIAIELIHHTRKLNGNEATVEDSRGGSALIGAVRVARVINPMTPEEANRFGLDTHIDHFRIEAAGKNNLARPSDKADWYERRGIRIENGDFVAIVSKWTPPDPFEGITPAHARAVQEAIAALDTPAAANSQATGWVGHVIAPVVGLDLADDRQKARVKALIRSWLQTGVLIESKHHDTRKGREVPVIVVGSNRM